MSAVVVRDLDVGYEGLALVEQLSFELAPGGLACLIGTNGSGKSTLLKTLAGLLPAVRGHAEVVRGAPGASPDRVAHLPQRPPTAFTLPIRARDVVAMGRFAHLGLLRRPGVDDRRWCAEAMTRMGVDTFADAALFELSGGQQQRTHLASALARRADVLLLDEPTAGLDIPGRELFASAVAEERSRGAAVVMATHDLDDADDADLVVLLARRVVAIGPPAEVLTDEHLKAIFGFTGPH
jgi:ABC-type Mn2+/Zn2+ transport system ATPase subunit